MKRNYRIMIILMVLLLTGGVSAAMAQDEEKPDLDEMYRQLDEAIEKSPQYVALRQEQINKQCKSFYEASDPERKLMIAEELFALFKPFKNDSALHYARVCIDLANSIQRYDLAGRYSSLMARQCSNASMYVESLGLLKQIDKSVLDRQGLTDYYDAWMHVCGEIGAYSLIPEVRNSYYAMQDHYRDSVLAVADQGSDEYLHLKMSALVARKNFQEALKVSDRWLNKVREGSHAEAYAAFYRHIVYANLGNEEMVHYWLAKSALDDIKCAVMDQASLITLAELLNNDGDLDRSYEYIRFTWYCNNYFNTRLRSSQIAPVLSVIESNYANVSDRNIQILIVSAIVFCIMALCLFFMYRYVFRQKKLVVQAQQELAKANTELKNTNHKLQWMNDRVMKHNKQLFEINDDLRKERDALKNQ